MHTETTLQRFASLIRVLDTFPVSKSSWYRGIKEGRYPQPIKISKRSSAWRIDDLKELAQLLEQGKDWRDHVKSKTMQQQKSIVSGGVTKLHSAKIV
ncbi:MAG: AlpA family phage regulatory protein [Mariprofundales bacterium]